MPVTAEGDKFNKWFNYESIIKTIYALVVRQTINPFIYLNEYHGATNNFF
jgi:hypothetical protein